MISPRKNFRFILLLVVALFAVACGDDSTVTPPAAQIPPAPANLRVLVGNGETTLMWDPVAGATSYRIYWNTVGGVSTADSLIDNATSPYIHGPLSNGTTYYYAISAINSAGASPLSSSTSAKVWPFRAIECGDGTSFAIDSYGVLWAWGKNDIGQLGIGTFSTQLTRAQVIGVVNVIAVSSTRIHTVALTGDGGVWTWGDNSLDQLGDNRAVAARWSPYRVDVPGSAIAVAAGHAHTVAVTSDGGVWVWGANSDGQLGLGHDNAVKVPEKVPGLSDVRSVAAGEYCTFALKNIGTIEAWGLNSYGQLGIGRSDPAVEEIPTWVSGTADAQTIDTFRGTAVALRANQSGLAWGRNDFGQVGDNTTNNVLSPWGVLQLPAATAITCGLTHTIALQTDGFVYSWGSGPLGDSTTSSRSLPEKVMNLSDVIMIATGYSHNLAVKRDGSLWAWGSSLYGQLGDGTTTEHTLPNRVPGF